MPEFPKYAIKALVPIEGWHAAFFDRHAQEHVVTPVHALTLAEVEGEDTWHILSTHYTPKDGWVIHDGSVNFCGLLPPDYDRSKFDEDHICPDRLDHQAAGGI